MSLKKSSIIYVILVFAILSGTLRLTDNGMTSFYRIFGPFVALAYMLTYIGKFKKPLIFFGSLLVYTLFTSVVFYSNISFDQIAFVIYIFFEFVLIMSLKIKDKNFGNNFFKFIDICAVVTIAAAWLQYFVGYTLPHVEVSRGQPLGVYFSNGNELSEAMCCVMLIYVYQILFCNKKKYIPHCVLIIMLTYLNDAKLSLIGALIGILILGVFMINQSQGSKMGYKSFFRLCVIAGVFFVLALYLINPTISVRDYDISLRELIFDAVLSILKGQELDVVGSIHDRTSAIIYGMRELAKSYGFGIGIGNSIVMLQQPQYYLAFAKSMHNILFQFLAECGYFAMVVYYLIGKFIVKCFKTISKNRINLLKATFFVSFIFISSQSSVGILANYFTIMVVIYIALLDEGYDFKNKSIRRY